MSLGLAIIPLLTLTFGNSTHTPHRVVLGATVVASEPAAPPPVVAAAPSVVAAADLATPSVAVPPPATLARATPAPAEPTPARTGKVGRTTPTAAPRPHPVAVRRPVHTQTGPGSWYDAPKGTCAHQSLPFGTVLTITDTDNGRMSSCTVSDRGPYQDGRILDMARDVFTRLAPTSSGVINIQIAWS